MNQSAMRLFVRSLIAEAKEKKVELKKSVKTEEKAPKSSGKLVDLKKELAALKQYKDELMTAKFAEKTASTEVEFADLAKFAKELDALKERGVKLEAEIDNKIAELETKISEAKNKIKEMMGLVPATTSKKPANKIMSEKKKATKEYDSEEADKKVAGHELNEGPQIGQRPVRIYKLVQGKEAELAKVKNPKVVDYIKKNPENITMKDLAKFLSVREQAALQYINVLKQVGALVSKNPTTSKPMSSDDVNDLFK
jgi:hypothetical protein